MLLHIPFQWTTSGIVALTVLTSASTAVAAAGGLTITEAKISAGKLVVSGTAAPNTKLRLDGQAGSAFNVKSNASGKFSFSVVYYPGDCVVGVQKAAAPGAETEALVADCGARPLASRGAWNSSSSYFAQDLVTTDAGTWLAKRNNIGKSPAASSLDWEAFAGADVSASADAASASGGASPAGRGGSAVPNVAPTGPAGGDLTGSYPNPLIGAFKITSGKIANSAVIGSKLAIGAVTAPRIANGAVTTPKLTNNAVNTFKIADESILAADLAPDSVGASEIVNDSVGSAEIAPGVVGADELDTIHEHFGTTTNISEGTAHDGAYGVSTSTVACGAGEDLLSVSVDWVTTGGHNELVFSGVDTIDRSVNPQTATVRVAYDGGAAVASYRAVATCIF